jgi:hypothetical protein
MDVIWRPRKQMDAQTGESRRERAGWYTREETTKLAGRAAGQNDARPLSPPGECWVRVASFGRTALRRVEWDPCPDTPALGPTCTRIGKSHAMQASALPPPRALPLPFGRSGGSTRLVPCRLSAGAGKCYTATADADTRINSKISVHQCDSSIRNIHLKLGSKTVFSTSRGSRLVQINSS